MGFSQFEANPRKMDDKIAGLVTVHRDRQFIVVDQCESSDDSIPRVVGGTNFNEASELWIFVLADGSTTNRGRRNLCDLDCFSGRHGLRPAMAEAADA